MTPEAWNLLEVLLPAILASRIWSMIEHISSKRKTEKTERDVAQIKIYINGEMEKKLEEARQKGIQEGIEIQKNLK